MNWRPFSKKYHIDFSTKVTGNREGVLLEAPLILSVHMWSNLATGAQPLRLGAASLAPTLNGVVLPEGKATSHWDGLATVSRLRHNNWGSSHG